MNVLEKWNPLRGSSLSGPMREMEDIQNRLSSFFNRRLPLRTNGGEEGFAVAAWAPPVDIAEDDKEYLIKMELPGVNKEDVNVSAEGGILTIKGERKAEKEEKGKQYHRIERVYGTFIRSFTLPEGAAVDKISAEFRDGILKVHLPKDEQAKPKSIEVKVG
jgi:HSP20 family protein